MMPLKARAQTKAEIFSSFGLERRFAMRSRHDGYYYHQKLSPSSRTTTKKYPILFAVTDSSSEIKNEDNIDNSDAALFQSIDGSKGAGNDVVSPSDDLDCVASPDSSSLYRELQDRLDNLEKGIGKRYRCRTQQGFLNIHKEPTDPFDTSNVIGKLTEGQVVASTGPNRGDWVLHDGGGWSISRFQGFTWLEYIQD